MSEYDLVPDNLSRVRERIVSAAQRSGRDSQSIAIMAVTKFHPVGAVESAWNAGLRLFGESRVQEAESKFEPFLLAHPDARLELIGSLQSNKAKRAVSLFSSIQSVDSIPLVAELDKRARSLGKHLDILLELHTGEESKAGFASLDELLRAAETIVESTSGSGLRLRGLMTMAPYTNDERPIRASFRSLAHAFDEVRKRLAPVSFDVLSMGMTNDYAIAVEEGSTLVRIGTALFGSRATP